MTAKAKYRHPPYLVDFILLGSKYVSQLDASSMLVHLGHNGMQEEGDFGNAELAQFLHLMFPEPVLGRAWFIVVTPRVDEPTAIREQQHVK